MFHRVRKCIPGFLLKTFKLVRSFNITMFSAIADKEKVYLEPLEFLEPLILSEEEEEDLVKDDPVSVGTQFLTVILGTGSSWLLLDALWVELPYFQRDVPEGLSLANQMTLAGAITALLIIPVYLCIDRGVDINYHAMIYILILIQAASCLMVACLWSVSVDGIYLFMECL